MLKTLGRILLASMFISGGASSFQNPDSRVPKVEDAGIPDARRATILNATIMMVAGMLLAVGILPKLAATALVGTLVPTTFVGHPFWKEQDPAGRAGQRVHFFKNLALLGGLLLVLADKDNEEEEEL